MGFDERVPDSLLRTQRWFGSIIEERLTDDGGVQPLTPRRAPISREAELFIAPSPTLKPAERIEIYNQQYWFRLIDCLQETYPLLVHLIGYERFNREIAVPYITANRPNSWSLNDLGDRLPGWLTGSELLLLIQAAITDWACHSSFIAGVLPPAQEQLGETDGAEVLLERPLALQPHLHVLQGRYALLPLRDRVLQGNPPRAKHLETLEAPASWALFRHGNRLSWRPLEEGEAQLLLAIQSGLTLSEGIEALEADDASLADAPERLAYWLQEWILRSWLSIK